MAAHGRAGARALAGALLVCAAFAVGFCASAAAYAANPFSGVRLYVNQASHARSQAAAWHSSRPADAALLVKLGAAPQSVWFGDWNSDVRGDVADLVGRASRASSMAVLVAYHLPDLDCGGYSGGGARSAAAYRRWIRRFAAGIGSHRAVVILEPDALAEVSCLSAANRRMYFSLLNDAISVLAAHRGVSTYVDAGNSGWQSIATMASRLRRLSLTHVRGFSLNVSNFQATAAESAYGRQLVARLGGRPHFVIDTSRNGAGAPGRDQWCNPPGRALGSTPTARTGDPRIDALLWVKAPGESDGPCNGGPVAGTWWPEYALGLAARAGY